MPCQSEKDCKHYYAAPSIWMLLQKHNSSPWLVMGLEYQDSKKGKVMKDKVTLESAGQRDTFYVKSTLVQSLRWILQICESLDTDGPDVLEPTQVTRVLLENRDIALREPETQQKSHNLTESES